MKNAASLSIFLCATAAFAVVNQFKTAVITDNPLVINVADHQFLRIYNFTQDGNPGARGFVVAAAAAATATPTPTPTATCTPTCSPSPCAPTPCPPTPTPTPTPTATAPPRAVLAAAIIDPSSAVFPDPIKQVVVDGPAQVTVNPVLGATLVLTYVKVAEPTPTPTPESVIVSTATPTPTP